MIASGVKTDQIDENNRKKVKQQHPNPHPPQKKKGKKRQKPRPSPGPFQPSQAKYLSFFFLS